MQRRPLTMQIIELISTFCDEVILKRPIRRVSTHKTLRIFLRIYIFSLGGSTYTNIGVMTKSGFKYYQHTKAKQKIIRNSAISLAQKCQETFTFQNDYFFFERYLLYCSMLLTFLPFVLSHNINMTGIDQKPAAFIHKLCNILRSKENSKIIYWDTELKGIRILNQKKLEEHILPRYYRHNRYSSFVRQLNMYDFHKVHLADHKSIFLHSEFNPKKKDQIHLIRRKVTFDQKSGSEREDFSHNPESFASRKQNGSLLDAFLKSSKKFFVRPSVYILSERNTQQLTSEKALDELVTELGELQKKEVQLRLKQLRKDKKYRLHLKNKNFLTELQEKLDFQLEEEQDDLSELSIEDELMFKTKRSLGPKSLKLVESGPLVVRRETFGNLFNF